MAKRTVSASDRAILDQVIMRIGKRRIAEIYLTWNEGDVQVPRRGIGRSTSFPERDHQGLFVQRHLSGD
jgi:hypothetical protein